MGWRRWLGGEWWWILNRIKDIFGTCGLKTLFFGT